MYPNVHFLGGKLVTVREVDVTTKAHQRHEGSPYSPFETTPRRLFSTTSGKPWGGFQTLTIFSGGNHNGLIPLRRLLPPRSLQPPRVTRSRGLLKTCSNHKSLWWEGGEGDDLSFDWNNTQRNWQMHLGSRIWCTQIGVREKGVLGIFWLC